MSQTAHAEADPFLKATEPISVRPHRRRAGRWTTALTLAAGLPALLVGCGGSDNKSDAQAPTPSSTAASPNSAGPSTTAKAGEFLTEWSQKDVRSFDNYVDASGRGPDIPAGTRVLVRCYVEGPKDAAPSAEGQWYLLAGPEPWEDKYAATNPFNNGDAPGTVYGQGASINPDARACRADELPKP
jgi:hypothetical protein